MLTPPNNVFLIAAVGRNGELGKNDKLLWHDSEDLKFFKMMTEGHVCIVGKNTFRELPLLLGRTVHVMKRNETCEFLIEKFVNRKIFIIGGATIYKLWMPYVRRSFITHIDYDKNDADTYMPFMWNHKNT